MRKGAVRAEQAAHARKPHRKGPAQTGRHAYADRPLARHLTAERLGAAVVGGLAADEARGAALGHRARHLALNRAAGTHVHRDRRREKGVGVVLGPELEQIARPDRLAHAHGHRAARGAAVLAGVAVQVAATIPPLDLAAGARNDLAHELAAVVGALVAHHLVTRGATQVGVGEVAVERARQAPRHGLVDRRAAQLRELGTRHAREHVVDLLAIGTHDAPHVVGRLHAALDLERAHAGGHERTHVGGGAGVLGAERAGTAGCPDGEAVLVHEVVGQAARLGAEAAVGAAAAGHARHEAHARVAEAERAVAKDLKLNALLGDAPDLRERELARERHAVRPLLAAPRDAAGVVDVGLRRDVQLKLGPQAMDLVEEAPVLDDEGVRAADGRRAHERERAGHLSLLDHDVDGHVDARPGQVRLTARRLERVIGEVVGAAAGVEVVADAAVDGVGPRRERRAKRLRTPRRSQQLDCHGPSP